MSEQSHFPTERGTVEINTEALLQNYRLLRYYAARSPSACSPCLIAVVKANAYGHGFLPVIPTLLSAGCSFFAVATLEEGIAVRAIAPEAEILILGFTPPDRAATLSKERLTQTVFSSQYADRLSEAAVVSGCRVSVHLKVDGGMCRLGFAPDDIAGLVRVSTLPQLCVVGLFTHFPCADNDVSLTQKSLSAFLLCRRELAAAGLSLFCHADASAALLTLPESVLDGVRVGIALYGIPPVQTTLPLTPVLRVTAPIVQVHEVPVGTPVGYGGAFVTKAASRIATVPVGYGDGISRALSGATVTLLSHPPVGVPLVGKICMDQCMVDVTGTDASVGDRICIFDDPRSIAARLNTIPYEVLTSLSPRLERKRRDVLS